ncbi:cytochrome b-c1 complex subunit 1, mitochondrial-like [Papilio machaon]|uniref:cytochrome b-c1 complex subunit 1, mitochondrial-like n=1 Tax=Papilio machaon TaxID=76193 RepID=UPI001E663FF3|nr:cytochrome b-c1 complex subunit 1, mitochondrial-like [Papilio machaon]
MFNLFRRSTCTFLLQNVRHYETYTSVLKNGVRVAVEETISPLVCLSLFIQTGSRFETAENNGISHFIEHMAFKGFVSMKKKQLEECLQSIGGHITARTTREYQSFSALAPARYSAQLVYIMSLIVTNIEFAHCDIQEVKKDIIMQLKDREASPEHVTFDYLHQAAFQETPLAYNVIAPLTNLENFDENEACSFLKQRYHPENIVLAASGGVAKMDIMSEAQKRLSHVVMEPSSSGAYDACRYTGSSLVLRDDSMPFAHVAVAVEVPGYEDPDYWPLFAASCILGVWERSQGGGETNGFMLSRAAASGLCELYEPFYIAYRDIGLWGVYYVAERNVLDGLLHNVQHQWMTFCTSVTDVEVQRGINYAKLKLSKEVEGCVRSCYDLGLQILYNCARASLSDKHKEMSLVNVDTIKRIGQKYIYDKCPVISAVGPTECLTDYSRIRSEMYWLRY